ncbi:MAG TPA: alpha/beta hydrolase, partial [Clostridia bacterium]|nr:alpha/beta hydrolase [Clostridia bacterium]
MSAQDTTNRVHVAANHWRPRFVANGIDVNDFDNTLAKTSEWMDWAPNWKAVGEMHEALGNEAEERGRRLSAAQAYQRAAWCYHLGKFLWFEDVRLHGELRDRSVDVYRKALPHLDPPAQRLEIPFEGHIIPGNLRRPADARRPPLVLLVPGLDSSKEELFAIEEDFLRRGLATLTIDGPGQSENSVNFAIRPDWETVITPLLDHLTGLDLGVDQGRIGLMGISMGAIYGPRAAARDQRIRALVGLAGPYNLGECWDALNPLTRGGYVYYTKSADEAEAKGKAYALNLEGILGRVTQPMLVIHGAKDGLFPPSHAERIAREAPNATLVIYPDGNHVCNNIAYKYRPLMADWLSE